MNWALGFETFIVDQVFENQVRPTGASIFSTWLPSTAVLG